MLGPSECVVGDSARFEAISHKGATAIDGIFENKGTV